MAKKVYPIIYAVSIGQEFMGANNLVKTIKGAIKFPSLRSANVFIKDAYNWYEPFNYWKRVDNKWQRV